MSVEKIIGKIQADAASRAAAVEREAAAEAEAIRRREREAAENEYARMVEGGRREARATADRILSAAAVDARRRIGEERSAIVQECLDAARARFPEIVASPAYPALLLRLIGDGIRHLAEAEAVILVHPRDLPLARSIAASIPGTAAEVVPAADGSISSGGAIIRSRNGKREVNQTFEVRLQRERPTLIAEVSRILFDRP
ncbi:MAG: V-type ATP synthase subunit E family protein [Methanomicrobiales archaeon]|nr:V-type ATP synthase subunit E family protein [Methanomicrobiales archaeon]MDI6875753.1 V-type ATP synthase subunit E family protein [Methanomicrobiales archaeon]